MRTTWKAVALTSALWGLVLVLAVAVALPNQGWRDGVWRAQSMGSHGHAGPDGGHGMTGGHAMGATSEYDYLAHMVPHHLEAIVAARQLRRSETPRLRELGRDIVTSQRAQVRLMEGWLADWYPDRPASDPSYEPMMRDLAGLSGRALDRAFLSDMIPHHMMAVMSSQHLLRGGAVEHPEVSDLAATIRDAQHAEIWLMRRWLSRLDGASVSGDRGAGPSTTGHACHGPRPRR